MFRDNEILDALGRLENKLNLIQQELRSEIIKREIEKGTRPDLIPYQWQGLKAHTQTGTPQQAAGVPDELPEWMIPIYQHFTGLIAVDVVDLVKKAAAGPPEKKSGWSVHYGGWVKPFEDLGLHITGIPADVLKAGPAGSSAAQAPRRPCGCYTSLPKDYHFPTCEIRGKEDAQKLADSYAEYQLKVKQALVEIEADIKTCPLCSRGRWCDNHVRVPRHKQAQAKIAAQPGGQALIDLLNAQTDESVKKALGYFHYDADHGRLK